MEDRMNGLEKWISNGASQQIIASASRSPVIPQDIHQDKTELHVTFQESASMQVPDSDQTGALDLSCSLGAFPGSSIKIPTNTAQGPGPNESPNAISSRILSQLRVGELYAFYRRHLDQYLHYILPADDTLDTLQARSPLLKVAICTVAAFCLGAAEYHNCFGLFKQEISFKLFAPKNDFDDVRALCIGAFWLGDVSAVLNGLGMYTAITSMTRTTTDSAPSRTYSYTARPTPMHHKDGAPRKGGML